MPLRQPTTTVQPSISVVIPLYNEADGLELLLEQLLGVLRPIKEPFELVLVDDGSTDGTMEDTRTVSLNPLAAATMGGSAFSPCLPGYSRHC